MTEAPVRQAPVTEPLPPRRGPAAPLVEVRDVQKSFNDGVKEVVVLKDISITVEHNEFIALVGPSGCGKSTLLRMLCGLAQPSSGQVLYRGEPIEPDNPQVTLVFQNFALLPWIDVLDNVGLGLEALGVPRAARNEKAQELIDVMGLSGFENAYPRELSGGMKQRVGIARALATDPVLLCMDEPFSSLDALTTATLRAEVLRLWQEPTLPPEAVVMVTHNVEEAVEMADRVIVLSGRPGRILRDEVIKLPRPRDRKDPAFYAEVDRIYQLIM
ncbi:MAG: ABC transporter ATP-binding protein [Thermoplasmatota archaeon]